MERRSAQDRPRHVGPTWISPRFAPESLHLWSDKSGRGVGAIIAGAWLRPHTDQDRALWRDRRLSMSTDHDGSPLPLDGNAVGGFLRELFAFEVTDASVTCAGCGTVAFIAETR